MTADYFKIPKKLCPPNLISVSSSPPHRVLQWGGLYYKRSKFIVVASFTCFSSFFSLHLLLLTFFGEYKADFSTIEDIAAFPHFGLGVLKLLFKLIVEFGRNLITLLVRSLLISMFVCSRLLALVLQCHVGGTTRPVG